METLRKNFIYPDIPPSTYKFGGNNFPQVVLRPDGDWRNFRPLEEYQQNSSVESSACYIYAQTHAIATLQEALFGLKDQDYSDRFNALLSGGSPDGGDPIKGAESIRRIDGLIPEFLLPFSQDISSWDDYHSFKGSSEFVCRQEGKSFLKKWKLNYDIVFQREDHILYKLSQLKKALRYSPCPLSVWGFTDFKGDYVEKPQGVHDTHLLLAVYTDNEDYIWVWDTYPPFLKRLPKSYNPDFCMRWSIQKMDKVKKNFIQWIIDIFFTEKLVYKDFKDYVINWYNK